MQVPGKEDKDFGIEEGEVVKAVLPAHDGTDHKEPGAAEEHHGEESDDLGVGGGRCVWGEGEL